MINFQQSLVRLLLVAALALSSTPAISAESFERAGVIRSVSSTGFRVQDQEYRIAPGAKLRSADPNRKRLSDFRAGDSIIFEGRMIGGTPFVDLIIYLNPFAH